MIFRNKDGEFVDDNGKVLTPNEIEKMLNLADSMRNYGSNNSSQGRVKPAQMPMYGDAMFGRVKRNEGWSDQLPQYLPRNEKEAFEIEQTKWRLAQENLDPETLDMIQKVLDLKESLASVGIKYNFQSSYLPRIPKNKTFEQFYRDVNQAEPLNLVYILTPNKQRWENASRQMDEDHFKMLEEMFGLVDELDKEGLRYDISAANNKTLKMPQFSANSPREFEPDTILL